MLLLIPLLPFVGFLVNASFGRRLPKSISGGVACLAMIASFVVSLTAVLGMHPAARGARDPPGRVHVDGVGRPADPVRAPARSAVGADDPGRHRHRLADPHLLDRLHARGDRQRVRALLLVPEPVRVVHARARARRELPGDVRRLGRVGLCSYLLIGFWFRKKSAADAGKKAFVVNRIGDFGFMLGMLLLFATFGTLDFQQLAVAASGRAIETTGWGVITIATLLLFLGATGKSAQIPLYVWLPDAMEGPTPVSALIHAATMVTAGVYMIGRNAVLFSHAPTTLAVVAGIGVATALMAGTIGLVQNDIKRVLAYSTVSQLGYMFLAMGVGAYAAGIFHLYTHAFFKALLFLGSGAVIHALAGEQDLRNMGGLKKYLPITYWTFLIGALAIAGVPLLSGFFSKDEILFRTFTQRSARCCGASASLTSLLTATYMFRLVFLAFHGERRHDAPAPAHADAAAARRSRPWRSRQPRARRTRQSCTRTKRRRRWRFR